MAHQNEKNTLLDFAKQIIRECAEQPKNSVYKTHTYILKICPTSGYTIEQVGKYLRRVRRGIARSKLSPPVKDYSQKKSLKKN